jgi:acyl-CoA synthetase (AMP-forming)/AMP-acid ligase II/aryl carrier-like protein
VIVNYLLEYSVKYPHKIAFVILENGTTTEKKISYSELASRVKKLSFQLTAKKLEGDKAVLIYQDALEFTISFLACQCAGVIPIPVPYVTGNKQIDRLLNIINDAQATVVFCTHYSVAYLSKNLSDFQELNKMQIIPTDLGHLTDEAQVVEKPADHQISFIQYTSGSTGIPKGVVITGQNLIVNQQIIKDTFGCDENSVIFSWLPFHHDMGLVGNILHTIYVGCTCILMSPLHFVQRPKSWLEGISKYKATHSGGPNFSYNICVEKVSHEELTKIDLSSWKVAYNGSEPIRSETIQRFSTHFKPAGFKEASFYPCYGLAEATLLAAGLKNNPVPTIISIIRGMTSDGRIILSDKANPEARLISGSGRIPPGVEIKIISTQDRMECIELQEGEICIAGGSVTSGYWNKDNNDVFYQFGGRQFLKTGDLGFFYNDELFVCGRLKEMLIIRGQNFFPYDIEHMVSKVDVAIETNGVAVFNISDSSEEFSIVAEIRRSSIRDLNVGNIIYSIEKTLRYLGLSPYDIVLITPLGIPRTTSGKLQRLNCKDKYQRNGFTVIGSKLHLQIKALKEEKYDGLAAEVISKGDYHTIKRYLLNIIGARIANLPTELVGDGDDKEELIEMGIDSIRATELINVINRELSINLDVVKVFQENTLSGLIITIENMLWLKVAQTSGKEITI